MLLVADATGMPAGASQALQGGALAVLAWMVWYMLARAFPMHTKALKDQRQDFLKTLQKLSEKE